MLKFLIALIVSLPALITPHPVNAFPNILAANVPNNIRRDPPFYHFNLLLIVSLIPFTINRDSSKDLTIFIVSSSSSFEIINAAVTDP